MTNMPDILQLSKAADYASRQSDRWLFIALLIVFGVAMVWLWRWFLNRYEALGTEHRSDQEKYHASLAKIIDQQNETMKSLVVTLDRNTEALKDCTTELRLLREHN